MGLPDKFSIECVKRFLWDNGKYTITKVCHWCHHINRHIIRHTTRHTTVVITIISTIV